MSSLKNKKEKSKNLLEAFRKERKESLIFEAIALDDTNPDIIYEYLNVLEKKDKRKFLDEFSKYKVALPTNLLLKFDEKELTQQTLFFNMIFIILSTSKYSQEDIIALLKKKFGNSKYLSYVFNQPISIENLNLFYYCIIVTIMKIIIKETEQSAINFVTILNRKIRYSIDYIEKITNLDSIKEENSLEFHLFFFNFLFMDYKLFEKFYDSLIVKKETDFNYFSTYLKDIKEFMIEIGKSNTIKSLLMFIDQSYKDYLEEIPDMIDYIFEKKLYFNNIESNEYLGFTKTDTLNIFLSGKPVIPNSQEYNNNIYNPEIIIINFGKIIITLIHEIFGNFFKLYLNKSYKYEKGQQNNSDLIIKFINKKETCNEDDKKLIHDFKRVFVCDRDFQDGSEGGEQLEIFLFGDRLNEISIFQSFYLLNIKNYEKNFYLFRNEFKKISEFTEKKSNFLEKYNLETNEHNNFDLSSDNKDANIIDEGFIDCDLIDFEKVIAENRNFIESKEIDLSLKKRLSALKSKDSIPKIDIIENDEVIKRIKNEYLEEKKIIDEEEKSINSIIYDLKFSSLLTKDLYEKFFSRHKNKENTILMYKKVELKPSKFYYVSKIHIGKCGTNLFKRRFRVKNK